MLPPAPGSYYPSPAISSRAGGVRIPRPAVILLGLLTVGLLTGLTRSPRGLGVVAAAGLLVATWDARARFLRVGALLALLVFAAPAPVPERPTERRPPARAAVEGDRFQGARDGVAELYQWAASGFSTPAPWADQPKGGRR